jgi:hypothetical protein
LGRVRLVSSALATKKAGFSHDGEQSRFFVAPGSAEYGAKMHYMADPYAWIGPM